MKKKITPVFSVIILIFLVICAGILSIFIKKYTPSGTIIDGKDYFQLTGDDEAGLGGNHQLEDAKSKADILFELLAYGVLDVDRRKVLCREFCRCYIY